ncbi:hypothetical protein PC9H_010902 [Pleurotus ostreatus]|uniref:L-tryptophan decarboxylase PsiD-like domain-containing protein n=2 Tax=Pleurotus ostreatus TaxID=5322 RepID=A0A067ND80_PLEO1|nr:uncharacterized protein PC9H_010902 [Pleurotus ostreatus]KAF7422745.1 hypothetical protein PC9H_010902 [Pleurotus ostreatus]KAJ8691340.1 hypothetical protein PTI98_010924 [Pleurotus ostreatus]KDQ25978.1 hypothetical protein PLEOSDRAFT_1094176 [Pleurotus ostreatus PC15]
MSRHLVRNRVGQFGGWMPQDKHVLASWLTKKLAQAGDPEANSGSWNSVICEFRRLIEDTPEIYKGFHEMFAQIPPDYENDPTGTPQIKDYMTMLNLLNVIISEAPEWHYDPENPSANDLVGFPINAVLDWPMGTDAGYAMFISPAVNAQFKKMFDVWTTYLTSYASTAVLTNAENGWFGPSALEQFPNFAQTYVCDPDDPSGHYGFTSWDGFFTRLFQPGQREIDAELVDNDAIVHSACESSVYRVATHVQARDRFWLKGQPYSVIHMLNNDPYASQFVGGTIYQAFLSATKYHRWHSPVNGVVVKTVLVPGTYYAESPTESFEGDIDGDGPDPAGPNLSQAFITSMATRCLIFIRAKDPRIGLICFIGVGMAEVSTCEMTVKEGDAVSKGQEIGMFHFGGSTHCLLFRPETDIQIDDAYIPKNDTDSPEVHVKAPIAWVGDKPYN